MANKGFFGCSFMDELLKDLALFISRQFDRNTMKFKSLISALICLCIALPAQADYPASKATWASNMTTYGQLNCNTLATHAITDETLRATYYDGERVFYQIKDYTGVSSWNTCAGHSEFRYRDNYLVPSGGALPGYWVFAQGLRMDYQRTGDNNSLSALGSLAANASFCRGTAYELGVIANNDYSREVAYCTMLFLELKKLGQATPLLTQYKNFIKGHFNQWFIAHSALHTKPFMVGLSAQALIQYYDEVQADSEIPTLIAAAADQLWSNFWDAGSQSFFYVDNPIPGDDGHVPAPDLNLLIAPLYAWLYHRTNSTTYKDHGDAVFAGGVAGAYLVGGKQFNQNYMWSFKYVEWRDATPIAGTPTPTATATPTPTPTPTSGPTPTPTPCSLGQSINAHHCRIHKLETLVCGHHPC